MSTTETQARILHLFNACDRHLGRIDPDLRVSIMEAARDVLMHPEREYVEAFGACLVGVPHAPRAAFMATLENAADLARVSQHVSHPSAPSPTPASPIRRSRRNRTSESILDGL